MIRHLHLFFFPISGLNTQSEEHSHFLWSSFYICYIGLFRIPRTVPTPLSTLAHIPSKPSRQCRAWTCFEFGVCKGLVNLKSIVWLGLMTNRPQGFGHYFPPTPCTSRCTLNRFVPIQRYAYNSPPRNCGCIFPAPTVLKICRVTLRSSHPPPDTAFSSKTTSSSPFSKMSTTSPSSSTLDSRAESRLKAAIKSLHKVLPKSAASYLKAIKYPDLTSLHDVNLKAAELGNAIEQFIHQREEYKNVPGRVEKAKAIIQTWFRASYPFATIFLTVARAGANVTSY